MCVGGLINLLKPGRILAGQQVGVDGGQHAALHRRQVWGERDGQGPAETGQEAAFLLDLTGVAMADDPVDPEPFNCLAERVSGVRFASGTAHAGNRVDDDAVESDQVVF